MPKPLVITETATRTLALDIDRRTNYVALVETIRGALFAHRVRVSREELRRVCEMAGVEVNDAAK